MDTNLQTFNNKRIAKTILILSFCLFLFTQFYSIYFRLYKHDGPIGLGDSSYYISRIAYFKEHGLFSRPALFDLTDSMHSDSNECVSPYYIFYGVISSLTLGKLAALTDTSAQEMFHYNFYIGILLISLVLLILFKNINNDPFFVATGFVLLMFYSGNGNYHGFFWVVPSFYSLLFLFVNIIIFFYTKNWKIIAPLSIFLLLFSHPLSLYCMTLLSFALFLHGILTKSIYYSFYKIIYLCLWSIIFLGIYKYLYYNEMILPLFVEGLAFQSNLSFEFTGFKDLWRATPFFQYIFGIFLPLTIASIYYCIMKREYILLSLFISSLTGLLLFCVIHPYGSRTFLYFEHMLILLYCVTCYNAINFILKTIKNYIFLKTKVSNFFPVITNSLILILCCCLFFFYMKTKLANDAGHKFQHSLFFQSDSFTKFFNKKHLDELYLHESIGSAFVFLYFDSFWDKKLIRSCMLPSILNFEQYKDKIFFGSNLKMYGNSRKGISVYLPKYGSIVLKKEKFQPKSYRLILTDTNLSAELINKFHLEVNGETRHIKNISTGWITRPMSIVYPDENKYPKLIPPWYSLLIRYIKTRTREGFLIVRNTQQYYIDFELLSPTNKIYLMNEGDLLFLNGSVELKSLISKESEYLLDIDWGTANEINSNAGFSFNKNDYPLLWNSPACNKKVQTNTNEIFPVLYLLTESFQDIKAFQLISPRTKKAFF